MMTGKTTQIVAQWSDNANLDDLLKIEDAITEAGDGIYEVDGHDVGSGTFNVFILADDAHVKATVKRIIDLYKAGDLPPGMKLAFARYLDAERTDWEYVPAYPVELKSFSIM